MEIKYFMTKPTITQSQKRFQESVGALFSENERISDCSCLFLKSSSDIGVIRNGGRNGARFAPQSFLSCFKKFSQNQSLSQQVFLDFEVADTDQELADFHKAQIQEAERISTILVDYPHSRICHLGGGHDHIYSLLTALGKSYSKILVINVDAHADTRTDEVFHSGTPFRQFGQHFSGDLLLFQIGLNPFANTYSTLSPLGKGSSSNLWRKDLNSITLKHFFETISSSIDMETAVIFSLDADALMASEVPGVSAINPSGISRQELIEIWGKYKDLKFGHPPIIGIYELNPLYDTLSSLSMKTLASFVFESFE